MHSSGLEAALQHAWLRRGPWAIALRPLSWVFGTLVGLRKALYALDLCQPAVLPVPVVVVGNLIAGGAGKTPTVMAVVRCLQAAGRSPGVISRGYGRATDAPPVIEVQPDSPAEQAGDEPLLLRLRLKVPVFVGADRVVVAASLLAANPQVDVLVSDDGLQHLRLPRAAQVVVFDERGAGNGWILPAGPLREPLAAQPPPRTVVLYNAPRASTGWPGHLATRRLAGLVTLEDWWAGRPATMAGLSALAAAGQPVIAAAGMAQPERFFGMLRAAGLAVTPLPLPDHHAYATLPWPVDATQVVVTEKDAVKLRPERFTAGVAPTRIWVAPLDFCGDAAFDAALLVLLN
ncbi:MAG: tetraacyldisaccharide 4'-kinase [Burkholderiaceae bacterium]|nr:tetraacyldisaccharide 4'-kinase [Burkholderiaceae bacterium]